MTKQSHTPTPIHVTVKSVYGVNQIYPVNDAAHHLAAIAGTKTISVSALAHARKIGLEVEFSGDVTGALTKSVEVDAATERMAS
jgi:hypothetical protein